MICIELFGMSRAGKTTQKNCLLNAIEREGLQVATIERPRIHFREFSSVRGFHDHYITHLNEGVERNFDKDLVVLDRGFYDRGILLEFDYGKSCLTPEDYMALQKRIKRGQSKIDKGFLFMLSPEESLERFTAQKREGLDSSHLNSGLVDGDEPRNLTTLYQKYLTLARDPKIEVIDTLKTVEEIAEEIAGSIFEHGKK
jgi:thymidylate kinase